MINKKMWHLLPGQGFPMLLSQEKKFIDELKNRNLDNKLKGKYNRDDLILLLTALRCGTGVDQLINLAEGSNLSNIYQSYIKLDNKRVLAVNAWIDLTNNPDYQHVLKNKNNIKKIMPYVGNILDELVIEYKSDNINNGQLLNKIMELASNVTKISLFATSRENELKDYINKKNKISSKKAIEIGVELYDPIRPGIYGNNYYLPNRVASLTPIKVRDLLNEKKIF
jgi:hypothetical protein